MLNSPFKNKTDPSVVTTCQCEGCNNPVSTKTNATGKYCSLSCGTKQAAALRKQAKIAQYWLFPTLCIQCQKPILYEKRNRNKFCSSSCAASHNNAERINNGYVVTDEHKAKTSASSKGRSSPRKGQRSMKSTARTTSHIKEGKHSKVSFCVVCSAVIHNKHRRTCSDECCSAILSENAKNRGLGGNKNTRAHGWYESPTAGRVWLESSYEYRVAKDLDEIGIAWTRPAYLPYVLNEQCKKYYADFYLTSYDVYLDPKNDFLITQDMPKIKAVSEQNNVVVLVLDKHSLSWNTIKERIEEFTR